MKLSSILLPLVFVTVASSSVFAEILKMRCKHSARSVEDDYGVTKAICDSILSLMRPCIKSATEYCQVSASVISDGYDKSKVFEDACGKDPSNYIDTC